MSNTERSKFFRAYFEEGCLCLLNNPSELAPKEWSDYLAIKYYEKNCKCSRNYIQSDVEGFEE